MTSKVDWITWKTDAKEIVNPKEINDKLNEYLKDYDKFISSFIYQKLLYEEKEGGLSEEALSISKISPQHEIAKDIIEKLEEIEESIATLKKNTYNTLEEQKQIEKSQLINEISESIEKEQQTIRKLNLIKEENSTIEDVDDAISIANDRIRKLNARLDIAKSL